VKALQESVALCDTHGCAPLYDAAARVGLARALMALGRDRPRALELARQAMTSAEKLPPQDRTREDVGAYLAKFPRSAP
jgi:hypothetical protein